MDNPAKFDPAIQTENIAYDTADLVPCGGCKRTNPPNRLKCLYCGHELEAASNADIKANFRPLEMWERGFNVILLAAKSSDAAPVARLLGIETDEAAAIIGSGQPLPVARVESETEAEFLKERLALDDISCRIVSDLDLAPEKAPVRIGAINNLHGSLGFVDFNTKKPTNVDHNDIVLIVTGSITQSRVDSVEKKGRGKLTTLDESSTAADEPIVDIYSRGDPTGFRAFTSGFDFSCLGDDKGLIAAENLRRVVISISEIAPGVKIISDYTHARAALGVVWPVEMRNDPKGLRNVRFGKRGFASTATSSNLDQFNRYSRLQWQLL